MNPKTFIYSSLAILLCSCTQMETPDMDNHAESGDFCVYLSDIQTKTINDGMSTKWVDGDNIVLFNALTGTTEYVANDVFTCDNAVANKFSGTLATELDPLSSYDWYAYYPYVSSTNGFSPNSSSQRETIIGSPTTGSNARKELQTGNNNMAHLCGKAAFPVAGFVKDVPTADFPTIPMRNVSSVIAVNVTNTLSEPIVVNSVNLVAPEPIVGNFSLDFTNEVFVLSEGKDKFVQLEVTEGTPIANGESAKFYIGVAPFTAAAGSELLLYINATVGESKVSQRLAKPLTEELSLKSGFIKTFNVNYTQAGPTPIAVNKSDFQTLNRGITVTSYKKVEYESFDGWKIYYAAVLPTSNFTTGDYTANDLLAGINGDVSDPGIMTSPLIAGGCGTLKFKYGIHKNNDQIKFQIDIKNAAGEKIKPTDVVEDLAPISRQGYLYEEVINIAEPFQIVITNLGPRGKTGARADWLAIFDIEWTSCPA